MKCLAAILTEPNAPLALKEIEWLHITYGQVLVRIEASGICGAQMQEIRGEKGSHFPRLLGHEACVTVVETGPGVRNVRAGDRAVAHWRKGEGIESDSPRFSLDGVAHTAGQVTTFSQYSVVSENRLTRVPEETPKELCALLGCGLSTALGTIENEANLKLGESVLIIGCGGLGLNLIMAAKLRGADHIAVIDVEDKHELAFAMGATAFWNKNKNPIQMQHWVERLRDAFIRKWPFDVVIDTTGNAEAVSEGLSMLAPSGRFICVGQSRKPVTIQNPLAMFAGDGQCIMATQGGRFNPSKDVPRYVAAHRAGTLKVDGIITHRIPLQNINDGLDLVRKGQAGRVLIEMNGK